MEQANHFFGTLDIAATFGRIRVSESGYAAHARIGAHAHAAPYLSFVVDGSYTERVGSRAIACTTNVLRYHPAGEEHADVFEARGGRCLNIELPLELAHDGAVAATQPIAMDSAAWPAMLIRRELRRPDSASDVVIEEIAIDLLDRCDAESRRFSHVRASMPMRRATEYIEAHLAERLSLRGIAVAAGVHETHLARLFRARTGFTAGEYVRRRRIARAQLRLRTDPRVSASTVGTELGFADLAHFSRTFRRIVGVSPSEFCRICKN